MLNSFLWNYFIANPQFSYGIGKKRGSNCLSLLLWKTRNTFSENVLKSNLFSSSCSLGCFHTKTLGTCWEDGESARRKPIKCWCTSMKFSPAGQGFLSEPPPVVDTSLVLMAGVPAAPRPRRTWAHLERVIHQPGGGGGRFPWIRSQHRTNPDFYCLFDGRSVWPHVLA